MAFIANLLDLLEIWKNGLSRTEHFLFNKFNLVEKADLLLDKNQRFVASSEHRGVDFSHSSGFGRGGIQIDLTHKGITTGKVEGDLEGALLGFK